MSLEYFLLSRQIFENIIKEIEHEIEIQTSLTQLEKDIMISNKKKVYIELIKIYDKKILELCKHDFEDDYIDIDPDRSQKITYCKICGFTK